MQSKINTQADPVLNTYQFYFAEQLNVSRQRKDSKSSNNASDECQSNKDRQQNDSIIERVNHEDQQFEQHLLEDIEQNQFLKDFITENSPSYSPSGVNQMKSSKNQYSEKKKQLTFTKYEGENQNEVSLLLDTDTYKNICFEENSKNTQSSSRFYTKPENEEISYCQIHEKPLEIVCIQDKELMCSHCALFGPHKIHKLAPLKQIEKIIQIKTFEVNQTLQKFKNLQFQFKNKNFLKKELDQVQNQILSLKKQIHQQSMYLKEKINNYQKSLISDLEILQIIIKQKLHENIKLPQNDQHKVVFQQWQIDATQLLQQLNNNNLPPQKKIQIFLNNFQINSLIMPESKNQRIKSELVSLQLKGKQYYNDLQQQLNQNVGKLLQIPSKLKIKMETQVQKKIEAILRVQFEGDIKPLLEQYSLRNLKSILRFQLNQLNRKTINNSKKEKEGEIKQVLKNTKTLQRKITQNQQKQKYVQNQKSMTQSTPLHNLNIQLKNQLNNKKPINFQLSENKSLTKKSLKYNRRQTLEDLKKLQLNLKFSKSQVKFSQVKSVCIQKRRISPCYKDTIQVQNIKNATSMYSSRVQIDKAKQKQVLNTHKRSPSDSSANKNNSKYNQNNPLKKEFKPLHKNESQNQQIRLPLQVLQSFKNSETQTFDLSNCRLNDSQIIYFVQRASKIRKIKNLKLNSNELSVSGLQKLLPLMSHCNSLNLSGNKLTQQTIDVLLKKRERLQQIKLINLSNNRLNQRKIREKLSQFKKAGIVITL